MGLNSIILYGRNTCEGILETHVRGLCVNNATFCQKKTLTEMDTEPVDFETVFLLKFLRSNARMLAFHIEWLGSPALVHW